EFPVKSLYFEEGVFAVTVREILRLLKADGYKLVVIVNGHGAVNHQRTLRRLAAEESERPTVRVEYTMAFLPGAPPLSDPGHAEKIETSLMMAMRPELVDVASLPPTDVPLRYRDYGVVDGKAFDGNPTPDFTLRREADPRDAAPDFVRRTPSLRHQPPPRGIEDLKHERGIRHRRAAVVGGRVRSGGARDDDQVRDPSHHQPVGPRGLGQRAQPVEVEHIPIPPAHRRFRLSHGAAGNHGEPPRGCAAQHLGELVGGEPLRHQAGEGPERGRRIEVDHAHRTGGRRRAGSPRQDPPDRENQDHDHGVSSHRRSRVLGCWAETLWYNRRDNFVVLSVEISIERSCSAEGSGDTSGGTGARMCGGTRRCLRRS